MRNQRLLITGIDRFIGQQAAQIALQNGFHVRGLKALSRQAFDPDGIPDGVELVDATLDDTDTLRQACAGVDIVWHTDSLNDFTAAPAVLQKMNVLNTLNLAAQAEHAGVSTLVHLSSVIVYGTKFFPDVTEDMPLPDAEVPLYQTKILAEYRLINRVSVRPTQPLKVVIIRAGDIYGPAAPAWIMKPLSLMKKGKFFLANGGNGIFNHVHINNLIDSLLLAAEKAGAGEIFNITDGANTTWRDFYTQLAELAGQSPPIAMPAMAMKTVARLQGKKLGVSVDAIDLLCRQYTYSIDKARHQLGYVPQVQLDQGLAEISAWLQQPAVA